MFKIKIITVGSPQLSFAKEGIIEYQKRLSRFADVQVLHIKENKDTERKIDTAIGNDVCILLDEKGVEYTTQQLSQELERYKNQSLSISILVGGPNGHTNIVRDRGQVTWSLSRLTFPHDVATMLVLEAVYRCLTILAGHPYHRE